MTNRAYRRVGLATLALLACLAAFVAVEDRAAAQPAPPTARLETPPPGKWTVGFAWSDRFSTLVASIPFETNSIAIFDNGTQEFTVYIPGAPARVNAEASEMLEVGSIIWVRRAEAGIAGAPPEDCDPVPTQLLGLLDERVGFGANATGGAAGCLYRVTNANNSGPGSLREGASEGNRWIVFDGNFTIELNGNIRLGGNTTIDGRGRNVEIVGGGLHLIGARSSNIIINDVVIRDVRGSNQDLLRVNDGASDFWFHHLALVGATDEYIDITNPGPLGAAGTVSWTHFQRRAGSSNEFALLIGDDRGLSTNHLMRITLHHNWFNGTRQRNPLVHSATVHMFNNVIQWRLYGIHLRHHGGGEAQVLSENDIFDANYVDDGRADEGVQFGDRGNAARVVNPLLLNGAGIRERETGSVFQPSSLYAYTLDPVELVLPVVTAQAGPRG